VVGDVLNPSKPAHDIVNHLTRHDRVVYPVNPRIQDRDLMRLREARREERRTKDGAGEEMDVSNSVDGVTGKVVDVLDLCIAPAVGLSIVQQAKALGINNVFIQPGAESSEIIAYCNANGMNVHQGCVLREMR